MREWIDYGDCLKGGKEMDGKKEIIKILNGMSGKYSGYEIFTDWIRLLALSIEQITHMIYDKVWQEREQLYLDTIKRYDNAEQEQLAIMTARLIETLDDGLDDVLGRIYMEAELGSRIAGQFFTPFHLSLLAAQIGLAEDIERYKSGEIDRITLNEPSCGGGAMIIASAKVLQESGINYQQALDVVAQDLDWKGVYMCYVQLSLFGISAICVQGDTLMKPYDPHRTPRSHVLTTPRKAGALL